MPFIDKLDDALRKHDGPHSYAIRHLLTKKALLESAGRPQTGIFFWVMNRDLRWFVEPFWYSHYGEAIDHAFIWRRYLAREISERFNKKDKLDDIENCEYALPRGRVVLSKNFKQPGVTDAFKFVLIHGNDSPGDLSNVAAQFNVKLQENCVPVYDKEWTILREDYEQLCQILSIDLKLDFKSEFDEEEGP